MNSLDPQVIALRDKEYRNAEAALEGAKQCKPNGSADDKTLPMDGVDEKTAQEFERVANLSTAAYALERKPAAKELGVTVGLLDAIRDEIRQSKEPGSGSLGFNVDSESIASRVIEAINPVCTLVHDSEEDVYALVNRKGRREVHAVTDRAFRNWVGHIAHTKLHRPLKDDVFCTVKATLQSMGQFDGKQRKIELRTAHRNGVYYIDLCNADWRVVEVTREDWQVLDESPVLFRRTSTMQPLPMPERGGEINRLWDYINIEERDRTLLLTQMVDMLRPNTQYPIGSVRGGEGSGKTSLIKDIRSLSDPNKVPTRAAPGSTRDLYVSAANNHALFFENMSQISDALSDGLCRIATGSGYAERELYTNTGETARAFKRPIMFEGIPFLLAQPDLIDRSVHYDIPPIGNHRSESAYTESFTEASPKLLGALLDLFSAALSYLKTVTVTQDVRMKDYARLGCAIHAVLGDKRDFSELFAKHQADTRLKALEASPAILALIDYIKAKGFFEGVCSQLLKDLRFHENVSGSTAAWPRTGKGMSNLIARHHKTLEGLGIGVKVLGHVESGTHYRITSKNHPTHPRNWSKK